MRGGERVEVYLHYPVVETLRLCLHLRIGTQMMGHGVGGVGGF